MKVVVFSDFLQGEGDYDMYRRSDDSYLFNVFVKEPYYPDTSICTGANRAHCFDFRFLVYSWLASRRFAICRRRAKKEQRWIFL